MARSDALRDVVTSWKMLRDIEARKSMNRTSSASLRRFVETMNAQSRKLIAEMEVTDPAWWEALAELATHAATLVTPGAKVFVDKQDRTNE